jgi:aminoglycoside 6-adenylyltransferase
MLQSMTPSYQNILDRYLAWAAARRDVRAVLIVGSRARVDHPADAWADLDIITLTRALPRYLGDPSWMDGLGEVWARARQHTAAGEPEWLVVFSGGTDVDFVFQDDRQTAWTVWVLRLLERWPLLGRLLPRKISVGMAAARSMGAVTFSRGYRILLDKDQTLAQMAARLGPPPAYTPPTQAEFQARVEGYWLMVERCAKKICRGENAVARAWIDGLYRSALLPMIEWHARAARAGADTWHAGRFLEEWADPRVLAALPGVFAPYEPRGIRAALRESMKLFDWLSTETAIQLGYSNPAAGQKVREYIDELFSAL